MRLVATVCVAIASCTFAVDQSTAQQGSTLNCSIKFRSFVNEMDRALASNADSVFVIKKVVEENLPVEHCRIEEIIEMSKESPFFYELFEMYSSYTVAFKNRYFIVSFSLNKDTGNIEIPSARTRIRLTD